MNHFMQPPPTTCTDGLLTYVHPLTGTVTPCSYFTIIGTGASDSPQRCLEATFGYLPDVTPKQAEAHNNLLSAAEIAAIQHFELDEAGDNLYIGFIPGRTHPSDPTGCYRITTRIGGLVSRRVKWWRDSNQVDTRPGHQGIKGRDRIFFYVGSMRFRAFPLGVNYLNLTLIHYWRIL